MRSTPLILAACGLLVASALVFPAIVAPRAGAAEPVAADSRGLSQAVAADPTATKVPFRPAARPNQAPVAASAQIPPAVAPAAQAPPTASRPAPEALAAEPTATKLPFRLLLATPTPLPTKLPFRPAVANP